MAQTGFGKTRAAFGKKAVENKLRGIFLPAQAQNPIALRRKRGGHGNFSGGNYDERAKLRIERPDAGGSEIEIDRTKFIVARVADGVAARVAGGIVCGGKISAVENQIRPELFDGLRAAAILAQRREQHGQQK